MYLKLTLAYAHHVINIKIDGASGKLKVFEICLICVFGIRKNKMYLNGSIIKPTCVLLERQTDGRTDKQTITAEIMKCITTNDVFCLI